MARSATSTPTQPLSPVQLLIIAISVWGLFAMPVTYTGGASLPHPHSFVQFVREAETGTMSHHSMPAMPNASAGHAAMGHTTPVHAEGDEAVESSPLMSPPSYGIERISLISAVQPALAASLFIVFAAIWLAAIRLTGRVVSPLLPPPRARTRGLLVVAGGVYALRLVRMTCPAMRRTSLNECSSIAHTMFAYQQEGGHKTLPYDV